MAEVVPTILAKSVPEYREYVERYSPFATRIQVDIADTTFSNSPTITEDNLWWPKDGVQIDIHMMVARPSEHLDTIIGLHPSLVIFHAEASENLLPSFAKLRENNIKAGIALLKRTFPGTIRPYIEDVDHVLIFAGTLGEMGGEADLMQMEKVPLIREIKTDVEIGWDGGANLQNIRALAHGDIDVINVGSAIAESGAPAEALAELVAESEKTGVLL